MRNKFNQWAAVAALVLATMAGAAKAQDATSGSISGTITDKLGAVVKGATVSIINTDRNETVRTETTNGEGYFTATSLPLGTYTVRVEDSGFKTDQVVGIVLHVDDALTVNRSLAPGSTSDVVTVNADALHVNLEDASVTGLINGTQLRELVLNNRNYEQLIQLQPGVAYGGATDQLYIGSSAPTGTTAVASFSVNGARNSSNYWTIDGADNIDRGSNITLLNYPSVDAIAEFKTLRGTYSAEFGRSASSQIDVVTRSGSNKLHGSVYEFFRNDVLNANAWANKNVTNPANFAPRPKLRYNDFGGTIGGPIWKDHTFFFFSEEVRRVINYATTSTLVPTAQERVGNFTASTSTTQTTSGTPVAVCTSANLATGACNTYGTQITNFSPTALAYIKDIYSTDGSKVPLPTPSSGQDIHTLIYNQKYIYNNEQELARIDHSFGSKVQVFYRYLHDSIPTTEAGGIFVGGGLPGVQTSQTTEPGTTHLGHITWTLSPKLLFDAGYAYSSGAILSDPVGYAATANSPDIKPTVPYTSALGIVPSISFSGYLTGISDSGIYRDYNHNHNPYAKVTKLWGNHTVISGVTYDHYQKTENATGNGSPYPQGIFTFARGTSPTPTQQTAAGGGNPSNLAAALANFLIGNANGGFTQGSRTVTPNVQTSQFEAFVQDNWHATRRLTLNFGVRYSWFQQPHDTNNYLSNFDPLTYNKANAVTVDSNGFLCVAPSATCGNAQGLNSGAPNPNADTLNGIILGTPGTYGHASPFGSQVGPTDKGDFAPRVGFAFDVFGDGKTALRGGYGIAYDSTLFGIYEQNEFNNLPYVTVPNYTQASFDNAALNNPAVNLTVPVLVATPYNYRTPFTQQYSFGLQQQLSPSMVLEITYVGNHGNRLIGQIDLNQLQPGSFNGKIPYNAIAGCTAWTSSTCERPLNQLRPYVGYNAINAISSQFTSNYNALQVSTQKKFSGQTYVRANYTFSRALTNNQSDRSTAAQNTYNIAGEYGRSALDRTDIFTVDGVWELPWLKEQKNLVGRIVGGWEISGIAAFNSGLPLTVTMSGGGTLPDGSIANDAAGLGILGSSASSLRPDQIANPNNGYGRSIHNKNAWFNTLAFTAPLPSSLLPGNERRGAILGPGFERFDVGLFRNFKIIEGWNFQLRGEAFNVANHTNYQTVGTAATTSSTFGVVTAARDNRILQVAAKLTF